MKRKSVTRLLAVALSGTMLLSSSPVAYAMEEDGLIEEQLQEETVFETEDLYGPVDESGLVINPDENEIDVIVDEEIPNNEDETNVQEDNQPDATPALEEGCCDGIFDEIVEGEFIESIEYFDEGKNDPTILSDETYGTVIDRGDCGATDTDSLVWTIYDQDGDEKEDVLVISGSGSMKDFDADEGIAPWYDYVDTDSNTVRLVLENGLNHVGESAFSGCIGLEGELVIPESVTSIGDWAFGECSGFKGSLVIPQNVESVGYCAFYNCSGFTGNLEFYSDKTDIGERAFFGCSGFSGNLSLPENINNIRTAAFYGCKGFTGNLVIPDSVTSIEKYAFSECSGLQGDLKIPESVAKIGSMAFYNCNGITKVSILNAKCEIWDSDDVFPKDAIISGYKNSTAQAYAAKYSRTFLRMQIDKGITEINLNEQKELSFTMGTYESVAWRSSDTSIAKCGNSSQKREEDGDFKFSCTVTGIKSGNCTIEAYDMGDNTVYAIFKVNVTPYHLRGCVGTVINFQLTSSIEQGFSFECETADALINPKLKGVYSVTVGGYSKYTYKYEIYANKVYEGKLIATGLGDGNKITAMVKVDEHKWNGKPTIDKEATCKETGLQSIYCSICGAKKEGSTEEVPLSGHKWNEEPTVDLEPTCKETGLQSIHCSVCGIKKEGSTEEVPLSGHKWNEKPTIDKEATCKETGLQSIYCNVCGAQKEGSTEEVPLSGHKWNEKPTVDLKPTCKETGLQSIHCSVCGIKNENSTERIPRIEHMWGSWYQSLAPSICAEGQEERVCANCGSKEYRPIDKLPAELEKVVVGTPKVVSGDHIQINWGAVKGAEGYCIYRMVSNKWKKVETVDENVLSYIDTDTKVGTKYYYSVRAYAETEEGTIYSPSNKSGVSITQGFYKDAVKMSYAKALSTKSVKIKWSGRKKSTGYIIYRKTPGGSWKKLATVGKVSSYTDKTCKPATTYQYAVKAYAKVGSKMVYSKMEKTGAVAVTKMLTPKLTVKPTAKRTASLSWTKQSNVGGYVIYRKEGRSGAWEKIKRTSAKASSYKDKGLKSKQTYYYIVKAYKKAIPSIGITEPTYSGYSKKKVKIK